VIFVALFAVFLVAGYTTRSYVGVLLPLTLFVLAVIDFLSWERPAPGMGDEVDVLHFVSVVGTGIGVLIYLGAVALGRRARVRASYAEADGTSHLR
jgi:drug/metabolite transporter (DMT)-like permease